MRINKKRFIHIAALLLSSLLLPFSAFAGSLFPSADSLFGVAMPDMRFAIGREPDSVDKTAESETHIYTDFTAAEYTLFSRYLAAENVTLKSFGTEMSLFTAELELNGGTIIMKYDSVSWVAWIIYPENTRPERIASVAELSREGILPDLCQLFGSVPMPSLGDALHRYPDDVTNMADGSQEQRWSGVTDADFEAFGAYLTAWGASLRDYAVTESGFFATVEREGSFFSFTYGPATGIATVTYPAGVYDERQREAEERYAAASALMALGRYGEALAAFRSIRDHEGYRDVDSLLKNDQNLVAAAREAKLAPYKTIGGIVTFGTYPQTASGTDRTPIEWVVLDYDEKNNRALLLSRYGLDAQPYNKDYGNITWEKCTLRTWLNGTFLNKAFTAQEQGIIVLTNVDNGSSQGFDFETVLLSAEKTTGGNDTQDKVFLLSYAEANKYLDVTYGNSSNTKSRAAPTSYAIRQGASTSSSYKTADGAAAGWWWLRSPGLNQRRAALVYYVGSLVYYDVNRTSGAVRPALWIDLGSDIF